MRPVQQQYCQIQESALFIRTLSLMCQKYICEVGFYSCQIYEPDSTIISRNIHIKDGGGG